MEQTAVEWLEKRFLETDGNLYAEDFTKAKEMEKQQIIDAYKSAEDKSEYFEYEHRYGREYLTAEPYYNETFKSE